MRIAANGSASRSINKPVISAALAMALWGIGPVVTKSTLSDVPPAFLLVVQLSTSLVFIVICAILFDVPMRPRLAYWKMAALGLLQPVVGYSLRNAGMQTTTATVTAFVNNSEIFIVAFLNILFFGVRMSHRMLVCSLTSFVGIVMILDLDVVGASKTSLYGVFLVFLGDIVASIFIVLSAKIDKTIPLVTVVFYQNLVSLVASVLLMIVDVNRLQLYIIYSKINIETICKIVTSGLFEFGPAFLLYMNALKQMPSNHLTLLQNLIPVVTMIAAFLCIGEILSKVQLIGAAVVIASVFVGQSEAIRSQPD